MKKVVHFEIPVDDMDRAKKFYSLFDWQIQDWPMPDGSLHTGLRTVDVDETTHMPKEPGAINGMMVKRDTVSATPSVTMHVESIDAYAEKIKAAGGATVQEKIVIPDMGAYAYFKDTEGNLFGLWEDAKKA